MHGREGGEDRKLIRHMWSVPSTTTTTKTVAGVVDSNGFSASCFYKDGRKINVGDYALFKPAVDSSPSVGIIRSLTSEKGSNLKLRVNWLYRPAEVKLLKGVALEAAPNEVFYSFHSDEIPAASLLHPCKVAFLRKGVELPPGFSSFVCRRVFDITNKCLCWLTDEDYIDERLEELDQLLHKTRIEMHASVEQQHGPRSPKPANVSAATSPSKHSADSVQNSSSNLSSHRKGKKRERSELSFEAVKRDRSSKPDDGDSGQLRSESLLNLEIARLSEKGGLTDSDTVMRLVHLMQPEKSDKKIGLTGRSMLAGIIAATDKLDCLNQFVQLRGLFVLNEWLQEVHKGKIGDSGNLRSSDKSVDDFLLVLLQALDKLPVNLNALQMCNIGKSVNHLRTHKNSEIQRKARSLVDMWKKRVEAEMKCVEAEMYINDVKSCSSQAVQWSGRSQHDSSHGVNRHSSVSDAAIRSPVTHHSSLKAASVKNVAGESNSKSASAHPNGAKSTLSPTSTNDKDGQLKITTNGGSSDHQTVAREEKSSSSSQSHTNSHCSSDQAKSMVPRGKEETRGCTAGSRSLNKNVSSGSKHRKSANGPFSGVQKDSASNRGSPLAKNPVLEKESYNATDASQENNNHKLIVKIPNRGRGLAQSVTGGSLEDSSCRNSRASSPVLSEKHDLSVAPLRGNKHDSHQYHEVDGSSTPVPQRTNETRRIPNVSKIACSPSRTELKSRKAHDSSFSSMNALIESCAKISEANVPLSAADDVGMNLLASVAAREISRSEIVSPAVSPHRNSKLGETSSSSYVGNQKQLHGDDVVQGGQSTDVADTDNHIHIAGVSKVEEERNKLCDAKTENSPQNVEGCSKSNGTLDDKLGTSPAVSIACTTGKSEGDLGAESMNKKVIVAKAETCNETPMASQGLGCSLEDEDKVKVASLNDDFEKKAQRDTALYPPNDDDEKGNVGQGLQSNIALEQNSLVIALRSDSMNTNKKSGMVSCGTSLHVAAVISNDVKAENTDGVDVCDLAGQVGNRISDKESDFSSVPEKQGEPGCRADIYQGKSCNDQNLENNEAPVPDSSATQLNFSPVALPETEVHSAAEGIKSTAVEEESKLGSGSAAESVALSPVPGGPAAVVQLGFDLNEGFNIDEGKNGVPVDLAAGPCPDIVCSVSPLQIPVSSASCSLPASVTVAAAAKGPFVPADDLLWTKRELGWILGWKGSAATSAFRPAEPRKVVEVPLGPSTAPPPDASGYKPARFPLDIDLNVADESSGQECIVRDDSVCGLTTTASLRSSGGLDLDLNEVDEAPDMAYVGKHMASNIQRAEVSALHVKPLALNVPNGAASGKRDFDLNNGPAAEESFVEQMSSSQYNRGNVALQPSLGPRINSSETGNCFSWYPPGTNYSVSVTPSALPDREAFSILGMGGGPQRVLCGPPSSLSFNPDAYRGSVLPSSPALPFHPAQFQYPVLPYGTSFPLPSPALAGGSSGYLDPATGGRVSAIPSQLVGNAAAMSFQYPHAYVVSRSVPDVGNNGVIESNHKWGKQGLDLNSGPGVLDEGRDESQPTVTRQVSAISPQSLAEEQSRMYCMGGGHPKRKEPEGGWNMDKLNFKQSPWR